MAKVLLPIPERDFDPTEVAVSWKVLTSLGHDVVFTTPDGSVGQADNLMMTGRGLPLAGWVLRANADGRRAYVEMLSDPAFGSPRRWEDVDARGFDGLLLPGGHRARGMRTYLESPVVQQLVVEFFATDKPVGAVCHGVLAAARSIDPSTGRSVLYGRRTTALTWTLERTAWRIGRRARFWDPDYYRTYTEEPGQALGYMSVQQEVTRALAQPGDFLDVPPDAPDHRAKTSGRRRDTLEDDRPAWVVRDGTYVSARWPGDVHTFATTFGAVLSEVT